MKIAIIGAGIIGRLLAFELSNLNKNFKISVFDKNEKHDQNCSSIAAGMLSPFCELCNAEKIIGDLGIESINLWKKIIEKINRPIFFQQTGTLVIAHHNDQKELEIFRRNIDSKTSTIKYRNLDKNEIEELESDLEKKFFKGLFFENEAQIDNSDILEGLLVELKNSKNTKIYFSTEITNIDSQNNALTLNNKVEEKFDLIIDCRSNNSNIKNLRSVRGEIITLHSEDIKLSRPIRLIHPRFPLYIAPRANNKIIIGATSIESSNNEEISVRSALELLTAAFSINSKFGEAKILKMNSGLRPALPDNLPKIFYTKNKNFIQINGLYRHGFLISPKISQLATNFIFSNIIERKYYNLFEQIDE
jgi:glycine oxidase